jgi:hypothetical protein
VPHEVLTENGKQFTARFGRGAGEVPFDRICRKNRIAHRLARPRAPTTTGKVEHWHQSIQKELLAEARPFRDGRGRPGGGGCLARQLQPGPAPSELGHGPASELELR